MDRKKFLLTTGLAAFALSGIGSVIRREDGGFTGSCETTKDILGPFYRDGSPDRRDLTWEGLPGNRIYIGGQVFSDDCETPLNKTQVEIWHCDTEGVYDNETPDFKLRGSQFTAGMGEYGFLTVLPGKYLNGRLYRPAHIHFRVRHPEHHELVSQVYFKGDPHIEEDPWASNRKAESRILEISPMDLHGGLAVRFDIYLRKL